MMHNLTDFQRGSLWIITGPDTPKELAIKDGLDEYHGGEIIHGRLYPSIDKLVDRGLVEKGTSDEQTNSYTLTQRGERELDVKREWDDSLVDL